MKITVKGNQEDVKGNPIPYHRTTQGSYWNKSSKRYNAWKNHVVNAYCDQTGTKDDGKKPVKKSVERYNMDIMVYFKDKTHADSDNVFKGIADALFENDKYLSGSFDFDYDKENPRVEVEISSI